MATVHPPLGHTTRAVIDGSTSPAFVQLTFTTQVAPYEATEGVYQLWTDLPNLNETTGDRIHGEGEWHAIDFKPIHPTTTRTEGTAENVTQDKSSGTVSIQLPALLPLDTAGTVTLQATFTVLPHPATFAYTFRRTRHGGEIDWFGNGGSNGVINLEKGLVEEGAVVTSGKWEGTTEGESVMNWKGVGVEVQEINGRQTPILTRLPSQNSTTPSLILGLAQKPPCLFPFSLSRPTPAPIAASDSISLAILTDKNEPLSVPPHQFLPAKSTNTATMVTHAYADISQTLEVAIKADQNDLFQLESSPDAGSAALLRVGTDDMDCPSGYYVLFAHSQTDSKKVKVTVPKSFDTQSPILVQTDFGRQILDAPTGIDKALDFNLEAGITASILRFTGFKEIQISEDKAIMLAAPDASIVQITEEQDAMPEAEQVPLAPSQSSTTDAISTTDAKNTPRKLGDSYSNDYSSASFSTEHLEHADPEHPSGTSPEVKEGSAVSAAGGDDLTESYVADDLYQAEDEEDDDEDDSATITPTRTVSVLEMIKRFLYGIWAFFFGPSTASPSGQRGSIRDAQGEEEDSESSVDAVETPGTPHERTPLLATPGLSRSASSSDAFSTLNSPESAITIKANTALNAFVENKNKQVAQSEYGTLGESENSSSASNFAALSTNAIGLETAPLSDKADLTGASKVIHPIQALHPVKIRSYTVFTFNSGPPFKFFAPTYSPPVVSGVKVEMKPKLALDWANGVVTAGNEEGGVKEYQVGIEQQQEGQSWDVRIESA